MQLEKAFIKTVEENNPKLIKHVIFRPNLSKLYQGIYFPRVSHGHLNSRKKGDWETIRKEISLLIFSINSAANALKQV